jgi:acyl-CoA thioesterase
MLFSEVLGSMKPRGAAWTAQASEDWTQGRSLFGGLQAALCVQAMRAALPALPPLRTLQTAFVAPVPPGTVTMRARLLRQGKNAVQVEARIVDGEATCCFALGVFGAARSSAVRLAPPPPAVAQNPDAPVLPYIPGVTPAFTQHFVTRWLSGGLPFQGSRQADCLIETELRDGAVLAEAQVLAFADVIPPIALSWLDRPAAGSSMTWMIELYAERFDHLPPRGWRFDAQLLAAADGYTSQTGTLWAPDGTAVALSRQSMVVFG